MRAKALAVLREGRLTVLSAASDMTTLTATEAVVRVVGSRGTYAVDLREGMWQCTCSANAGGSRCGHIAAAQLVLGVAPNLRGDW